MAHPCLVVLTARGPDRLLAEGGTQAWRLNQQNAMRTVFCVCVQNRHNGDWGGANQEHHKAFLVGRISDVVASPEGRHARYLVKFSDYARLDYPNAWPGLRNPVRYGKLEDFGIIDPAKLDWRPMPQPIASVADNVPDEDQEGFGPLTLTEAKAGLALGLSIPETAIEIIIRY